ncbi:protein expanded [Schistocerca americana]|uniref:protein expanded n=1 Tax=Schistocerca americana TaxID=7009 RepID=UPI001F4FF221|nr:protein expanded [Schistocerca americana]
MQHCTVSAPVHSCSPASLAASAKYAAVELLNKQRLYFVVEVKSRAKELYKQTCAHLSSQGMLDTELFGLAIVVDGEFLFVDPDSKLSKYAPKHWKSSHGHGLDGNGRPSLVLYFRVQFYVDSPLLLRDEETRHHYYLQLRHNVVSRGLLHACASEELLYLLAGLALQADLGDYNPQQHTGAYFSAPEYFPKQMVENSEQQLVQTVPTLHRDNRGMGRARAELLYIREASSTEVSPLTHNSHLYRLRYKKNEQGPGTVWLAITAKGIQIYEEISAKTLTATFLWNNIGKLCFDRKKFEIRALNWPTSGEKFTYYTSSDEKSKHLLFLCRTTHQFSMAIQPRLSEVRRKEEEERKRFRDWVSAGTCKADQRTSVISNTSSNTTSGIVSDRVHSLDESEDELEGEIMITSPPAPLLTPTAPPSVESLALAHLRDDDSDAPPSPPPRGSSEETDHTGMASGLTRSHQKTSPNSSGGGGGAATPATTDGSQCSSSCSTVVVAGPAPPARPRRASTSSSLELGFSHTAQNSAVSEPATSVGGVLPAPSTLTAGTTTVALDYSVRSAHTSSGVYTLTTSAGSRPGTPDSCVSAASFRGDGSDPPAAPPRSPLSAAELSHLIMSGRPALDDPPTVDASESFTVLDTPEVPPPVPPLPPPDPAPPPLPLPAEPLPSLTGSGEVAARLVTTRPHISVLTAHASVAPPAAAPSYAAPTHTTSCHRIMDKMKVQAAQQFQVHLHQQQQQQQQIVPVQLTVGRNNYLDVHASRANANAGLIHASLSRSTLALSGCASSPSPGSSFSATGSAALLRSTVATAATSPGSSYSGGSSSRCQYTTGLAGLPLGQEHRGFSMGGRIGYLGGSTGALHRAAAATGLSFSATGSAGSCGRLPPPPPHLHARRFSPPPPPLHPRQPPPPPPPSSSSLATVYTSQVTRGQIEQFRQQMFSDVDYVIYPMCDPALSRQEYADAKAASTLSLLSLSSTSASASRQAVAAPPPPPPYAWGSGLPGSGQGLRRGFPAYSCSTESLLGPPTLSRPLHHQSAARYQYAPSSHRALGGDILRGARSHEDLLGCSTGISAICAPHTYDRPVPAPPPVTHGYRRLPPPPPPPPYDQPITVPVTTPEKATCPAVPEPQRDAEPEGVLDIRTLREKSKNLDLPLISALCNDRSLLEQTNAFVMPRHPRRRQPSRSSEGTTEVPASVEVPSSNVGSGNGSRKLSGVSGGTLLSGLGTSKLKYPVSGLSTTQISKPRRKASSGTHVHTHPCSSVSTSSGAIKNEGRNVGRRDTIMP